MAGKADPNKVPMTFYVDARVYDGFKRREGIRDDNAAADFLSSRLRDVMAMRCALVPVTDAAMGVLGQVGVASTADADVFMSVLLNEYVKNVTGASTQQKTARKRKASSSGQAASTSKAKSTRASGRQLLAN